MPHSLSQLRADLEQFAEVLNREEYASRAGLALESRAGTVRERFAHLAARDTLAAVREAAHSATDPEERRRLAYLAEFVGTAALDYRVRALQDRLQSAEAAETLIADGESFPFHAAEGRIKNEGDRARRGAFERARLRAVSGLNGLRREMLEAAHEEALRLGFPGYLPLCETLSGIRLAELHTLVAPLLPRTRDAYQEHLGWHLRRFADVEPGRAHRHDLLRVFRAAPLDGLLPPDRLREAAEAPVRRMGLDPRAGGRIRVDDLPRPAKSPRAFVAAPRVPEEVILVVRPGGGPDDYAAYLHELGHALHFAYTDLALPVEYRRLGDASVGEAFAFLFDNQLRERHWLRRFAGVDRPRDLLRFTAFHKLWYLRRYAAKLEYELGLHGGEPLRTAAERYRELLTAAAGVEWPRETYLSDVDPCFYAARYLRAWIFEAQLRGWLRERFDEEWYRNDQTGPFLRELWRQGQRESVEELSARLGIGAPALEPLLAQIMEDLE